MKVIRNVKLVSSILLAVCLFLPLSQCAGPVLKGHTGPVPLTDKYMLSNKTDPWSWGGAASFVTPLILALIGLKKSRNKSLRLLEMATVLGALWALGRVFAFSTRITYGGYLALVSIVLIFVCSLFELVRLTWSRREKERVFLSFWA